MRNPQNKQKAKETKMNANDKAATVEDEQFLPDLRGLMNMGEDGEEPTDYELRFDYVEADTYDDQPEAFYRSTTSSGRIFHAPALNCGK
jgi:hypothetical protein